MGPTPVLCLKLEPDAQEQSLHIFLITPYFLRRELHDAESLLRIEYFTIHAPHTPNHITAFLNYL